MVDRTPQGIAAHQRKAVRDEAAVEARRGPRSRRGPMPPQEPPARVDDRGGVSVIRLRAVNVWDLGDLARLRRAAARLAARGRIRVGVDMARVGLLPSGFMGMLCEWQERGLGAYLLDPGPGVRAMLWFRKYAAAEGAGLWRIDCVPRDERPAEVAVSRPPPA